MASIKTIVICKKYLISYNTIEYCTIDIPH